MTGIDNIIARLEADARAEIDQLNAETKSECDAILAEFQTKADAAYAARVKEGKASCAQQSERALSAAELDARKELLTFKQVLVSEVFAKAGAKLTALPRAEYVDFLANQAARAAVSGAEELLFNAKDLKEVGAEVAKAANKLLGERGKLTVSNETRPISGGVIVKQGDIEANCAVDMLVQLRRNDLASQVAEILFS